ncbi:MAG: hypothetical protein M0Z27_01285 [Thermaerobacter sp.]|nr:hypothetical protein [Thermaerobacter sp.]
MGVLTVAAMYARPYLEALMGGPWPASGMDGQVRRDLERALGCRLPAITGAADLEAAAKSRAARGLFTKKTKPSAMAQEMLPLLDEVHQPPPVKAVAVGDAAPKRRRKAKRRKPRRTKTVKTKAIKTPAPKPPKRAKPPADVATPQAVAALAKQMAAVDLDVPRAARLAGLDPKALARMLAGRARMPQAAADRLRALIRAALALREEVR